MISAVFIRGVPSGGFTLRARGRGGTAAFFHYHGSGFVSWYYLRIFLFFFSFRAIRWIDDTYVDSSMARAKLARGFGDSGHMAKEYEFAIYSSM